MSIIKILHKSQIAGIQMIQVAASNVTTRKTKGTRNDTGLEKHESEEMTGGVVSKHHCRNHEQLHFHQ